jgi:hypothetical protein
MSNDALDLKNFILSNPSKRNPNLFFQVVSRDTSLVYHMKSLNDVLIELLMNYDVIKKISLGRDIWS